MSQFDQKETSERRKPPASIIQIRVALRVMGLPDRYRVGAVIERIYQEVAFELKRDSE